MSLDVSKLNVVNRDYKSIFSDLIKTIPTLTEQWVTDDESDPGVVLVKLMSMLGDMLSYNTDKAYLEAYPDTVTQRKNAYQIFKLIGYKMNWYRSATCEAYFNNGSNGFSEVPVIVIPRYTKIMSKDSSICYTNPYETMYIKEGIDGKTDVRQQTTLIEGVPVTPDIYVDTTYKDQNGTYVYNNNEAWHSAYKFNVDKSIIVDSRIYFDYSNVEQSYITLIDDQGEEWTRVDNIDTSSDVGAKIFEFDVDEFDNPYIKLADYWENLNINKFKLFYILSSGIKGKINDNVLYNATSDLYELVNGTKPKLIIRHYASSEGYDPETPDEARKNSAQYINTFNTLVTLNDFTKAIKRNDYVSNAISKDATNDFNAYPCIAFDDISDLVNKIAGGSSDVGRSKIYTYNSSHIPPYIMGNTPSPVEIGTLGAQILASISTFVPIGTVQDYNAREDLYQVVYAYNYAKTHTTEVTEKLQIADSIIYNYKTMYNRNITEDLTRLYCIRNLSKLTTRQISTYIVPNPDYANESYVDGGFKDEIESSIEDAKMIPLDIRTTTNGIDYYTWTITGTVYLKNPVSYAKSQDILVAIDDTIKKTYSTDNVEFNQYIKPIDLVNSIIATDPTIYYVDLNNIIYNKIDVVTNNILEENITDKMIVSGEKFLSNLAYKKDETSLGSTYNRFFNTNQEGNVEFKIDLLNDTYYEGSTSKYYLSDYTSQELDLGNILIKPGSFSVSFENGSYIVKDNGYGSLVCNENIIKSSKIEYKKDSDNKIIVKFELYPEISISNIGSVNIKFARNKLSMTEYSGFSPSKFIIDDESIEV